MRHIWAVSLFALISWVLPAKATVIGGTFRDASGAPISGGIISARLQSPGARNTCVTPSVTAFPGPIVARIEGGAIQGTYTLTSSDCLTPFTLYIVEIRVGTTQVMNEVWYVLASGGTSNPTGIGLTFYQAGITASSGSSTGSAGYVVASVPLQGLFRRAVTGAQNVAVGSGAYSVSNQQVTLSTSMPDLSFMVVCSLVDQTSPLQPQGVVGGISFTDLSGNSYRDRVFVSFGGTTTSGRTMRVTCRAIDQ